MRMYNKLASSKLVLALYNESAVSNLCMTMLTVNTMYVILKFGCSLTIALDNRVTLTFNLGLTSLLGDKK